MNKDQDNNLGGRPKLTVVPDLEPESESPAASTAVDSDTDESAATNGQRHLPVRLHISVDREFFSYATSGEIDFPEDFEGPIEVVVTDSDCLIGRRSDKRSVEPDIDLAVLTADPAVSIEHARIHVGPNNEITITDLGSTNGTVVGVPAGPDIDSNTKVPLAEGSSAYLGAWSKVTVDGVGW